MSILTLVKFSQQMNSVEGLKYFSKFFLFLSCSQLLSFSVIFCECFLTVRRWEKVLATFNALHVY